MRLLFLLHSLRAGGAERVTAALANHWAASGWEVGIATFEPQAADFHRLHPAIERHVLPLAGDSSGPMAAIVQNFRRVSAVRALLERVRPDVAVAMMTTSNVLLALARGAVPGMVAIGSERVHPPRMPIGRAWHALRRLAYGRLDSLVALDRASAAWLERETRARHVTVIPNAAPWPVPETSPRIEVADHVGEDARLLLAVGRLEHQKGFDRLLDAFAEVASHHPRWRLVILGEGALRTALEAKVHGLGLAGRIVLPGLCGNVGDWYARADLYVLSSRFEGFPNTLVEAMAAGVPAVAFDCETGPGDIVRAGRDGLLVPEGDVPALGAALSRLMTDDALRAACATAAVEARSRYSMARVAGLWQAVFDARGPVARRRHRTGADVAGANAEQGR